MCFVFPALDFIESHSLRMTPANFNGGLSPALQIILPGHSLLDPSKCVVDEYPKSFPSLSLLLPI